MAGMSCIEPEAVDPALAGACISLLAGRLADAVGFFCSPGDGAPRLRTGRSGSSSTAGTGGELEGAGDAAGGGGTDGGLGCVGSAGLGFSAPARLNTGGHCSGSASGFEAAACFFLADFAA